MLVIPMKNYENEVIGVCQLLNRQDPETGTVISFSKDDEVSTMSLASQAAVAITNAKLITDLRNLLESFIRSIATAIDAKSPYTGGHVRKVAEITMIVANAINEDKTGYFKDVTYSYDQLNELRIAALMHDVGKITTPEYVVDKSTKLETIYDRIGVIRTRFEVLKRDLKIAYMEKLFRLHGKDKTAETALKKEYHEQIAQLDDDLKFLEDANIGGEFMADEKIERVKKIAQTTWVENGVTQPLLSDNEVENITIRKGTLTDEERLKINDHARMSLEMLNKLPFPKKLRRVPEIAGGHHEKLNGKGYPQGLSAEQLTLEARVLALADIFEALTASDRPYKDAKKISEVVKIINFMVKDYELDPDLVAFFYERGLHIDYAQKELKPEQLDIDIPN
jgi:HD-GYP domain-containing protein (c-di-GMP phosphodiesterase class II)